MCGISAVSGENAVVKALMVTLGQLERGRKGCGVAFTVDGNLFMRKAPVHPIEFFSNHLMEFMRLRDYNVTCAIAHNRMPSAGKICYENTHPFMACDRSFALVHNGHSVNGSYRKMALECYHILKGETDSEVITHMIEEESKTFGDVENVLLNSSLDYLSGAIFILTKDGVIYGTRTDFNPIYVGECDEMVVCGSTHEAVTCVASKLKRLTKLRLRQVVKIKNGRAQFLNEGEDDRVHIAPFGNFYLGKYTDYFQDLF
jgi:glucosamine--fructose-6-phosphate aminotransferase (isomerizing)